MTAIELLTTEEMARADHLAVASGVSGLTLMENAGRAVTDEAERLAPDKGAVLVLAGPGNNGGDGYVAARLMRERGYDVRVAAMASGARAGSDAAVMAGRWRGAVVPLSQQSLEGADLVVDALFGAGLTRPIGGEAARVIDAINAAGVPVLAVDVPSGLKGDEGFADGPVAQARRTATFFRLKPGHLLFPGRGLCGSVALSDIGIPSSVLAEIMPRTFVNRPELWLRAYPWPEVTGHKYGRGHAVAVSGPMHATGAARLGARAALRVGAGLVTLATSEAALPVNAAHLTAVMLAICEGSDDLSTILADRRRNACLIGPGLGLTSEARRLVHVALGSGARTVLDADALTAFEGRADELFRSISAVSGRDVVLTPHAGEFGRLFGKSNSSKLAEARAAAELARGVVVLKGPDTVIASPDGRAAINDNAPAWLATAGSGDVLAGLVAGLLAQGMPTFEAACAAVWLHGECAQALGAGLIAEDLPEVLPQVLKLLAAMQ